MEVSASYGPVNIIQEYMTTVRDGFCLSFMLTYTNEEQKTKLHSFLDTVKFDK